MSVPNDTRGYRLSPITQVSYSFTAVWTLIQQSYGATLLALAFVVPAVVLKPTLGWKQANSISPQRTGRESDPRYPGAP